jgi:hypothetical protein
MDLELISVLEGEEAAMVMVYADASRSMLPLWDDVSRQGYPVEMRHVHYNDVSTLCLMYGIHHLPAYICNRGDRVRVGYRTVATLESMIQNLK